MNKLLGICLSALTLSLAACGGGGGSDSVNSSFEAIVKHGTKTYMCKSQTATDACKSASADCSACESTDSNSQKPTDDSAVITTACTVTDSINHQVTQAGCILNLSSGTQTAVCSGTSLKMLSGTGLTKEKVLTSGSSFSGKLTLNGQSIKCA